MGLVPPRLRAERSRFRPSTPATRILVRDFPHDPVISDDQDRVVPGHRRTLFAAACFARGVSAGPREQILPVRDRAVFPVADDVVPAGTHRELLPLDPPEPPPAERPWPLTNKAMAAQHVADITAIEGLAADGGGSQA